MTEKAPSKLTFPCEFIFKVVGNADDLFESEMLQLFRQHFPQLGEAAVSAKTSKNSKYLALSITVPATSQEQLDNLYQVLSRHPMVLFVL